MSIRDDLTACELLSYVPYTENRLSSGETLEVIIPDKFPDAAEIIALEGYPALKGHDENGSVSLQAVYELSAVVRAENGSVYAITAEIPVTIRSSLTCEEQSAVHASVYSLSRDARIVNSRKLAFSCEIGANLTVWTPKRFAYLAGDCEAVIAKRSERTLLRRSAAVSESFFISDELPLPAGKPEAGSVVAKCCRWRAEETRLSGEKLIYRAVAALDVGYLSKEGEWCTAAFELPFTRIFDLPSVSDAARTVCHLECGKMTVLPQTREESDVFAITIAAEAHILCYETAEILAFDDLYSLETTLLPTYESFTLPETVLAEQGRATREETMVFPHDPEDIASFLVTLSQPAVYYAEEGQLRVEATAHADFLYLSDGRLQHLEKQFPVEWSCAFHGNVQGARATVNSARYTLPAMRKSELSLTVDFTVNGEALTDVRTVTDLAEEAQPLDALPSFLYLPRCGTADLFALGKAHHADPAAIASLNQLAGDEVISDMPLLIPVSKRKS